MCDSCTSGDTIDFTNPEHIEMHISEKVEMGLTDKKIMLASRNTFSRIIEEIFVIKMTKKRENDVFSKLKEIKI